MTAVHVLNGPNLNLLGKREPAIYGSASLEDIRKLLEDKCAAKAVSLVFKQSNIEGELISWIQEAGALGAPVILNAGAFTHTSIALYDAIKGAQANVIELTSFKRLCTRKLSTSLLYLTCRARIIAGFGPQSYLLALEAIFANI